MYSFSTVCFYAEAFKTFPVLEQLELCMCGVSDISVHHTDFTRLQVQSPASPWVEANMLEKT